ncbi:hypothetical protein ACTHAM_001310 [Cellulomonas soli]|uniref:proline-rich domain-containing protein n=1 Tax=Cellulomonas soli TaxID=931535 RepID=UPI003F83E611
MTMPEPDATPPTEAAVTTPARGVPQAAAEATAPADVAAPPAPAPSAPPAPAYGPVPPAPQFGPVPPTAQQYGPVPPTGEQYGPVPPTGQQYGPVPPNGHPGAVPPPVSAGGPGLGVLALPAAAAGLAYAATLIVAFVASIALVAAVSGSSALPDGALLSLPFVLAGAALLGPLHSSGSAYGYEAMSLQLTVVPLTLTLVALAAVAVWTRLRGRADRTAKERWRDALVTGAILGVGGAFLAALVRLTWSVDAVFVTADLKIGAAPVGTLLGGFLIGTLGSALGSATTRRGPDSRRLGFAVPRAVSATLGNLLTAGAVSTVLVAVVGGVVGVIKLGVTTTIALLLTLLPNATLYALSLGAFGGLTSSGSIADGGEHTASLFSDGTPAGLWACVALVLVAVLVAAVRGFLASGRRGWGDAWVTPAVLVAVTGLAAIVTSVRLSTGGDLVDTDSGAVHISFLTILLAAFWGLVIEAAERVVAPAVVSLVPALPGLYARATGRDAADAQQAPAEAPTGDQRTARIVTLSILGAVVVLGGLLGARAVVSSVFFSPEAPAMAYVEAIQDGRASDALALADPDLPTDQRTLLTDDVYGAVENRPTGGHVTDVRTSGDDAWVTVESKQDGATVTQELQLTRQGHAFLLFDRWVLVSPAIPDVDVYAALPMDATSVLVNGVETDLRDMSVFSALPGTYTLSLPVPEGSEDLLTSSSVDVTVEWPSDYSSSYLDVDEELAYTLTDEATSQLEEASTEYLTADCIGAGTLTVETCGLDIWEYREDEATAITWTLDGDPTFETTFESPEEILVHVSGEATVSYTLPAAEYWPAESPVETDDYDFWITYAVTDGKLVQTEVSEWGW